MLRRAIYIKHPSQVRIAVKQKKKCARGLPVTLRPLREREPLRATPSSRVAGVTGVARGTSVSDAMRRDPTRTANALRDSFACVRSDT